MTRRSRGWQRRRRFASRVRTGDTPAKRAAGDAAEAAAYSGDDAGVAVSAAHEREEPRDFRNVRTVIVDEIHALARDKRGSHLSLSLARLDQLCESPPTRIGLSATQRPIDEIARFLVGFGKRVAKRWRAACAGLSIRDTCANWIWRSKCRRASCRLFARSKLGRRFMRGSAN